MTNLSKFPDVVGIDIRTANCIKNSGWSIIDIVEMFEDGTAKNKMLRLENFGRLSWLRLNEYYQENRQLFLDAAKFSVSPDRAESVINSLVDASGEECRSKTLGAFRQMEYQYRAMVEVEISRVIREEIQAMGLVDEIRRVLTGQLEKLRRE